MSDIDLSDFPGFDSYYPMMSDQMRVSAYRQAIFSTVQKGDLVLDLGAGLGLLSFFALQAGAKKVYAIEERSSAHHARQIAEDNGFSERIEFISKNSTEVDLDEKVDVLLTETMGSFGIDENMSGYIEDARQRLLKPGGQIIPQSVTAFLALTSNRSFFDKNDFWLNAYGIDFSRALKELWGQPQLIEIPAHEITSPSFRFAHIDFNKNSERRFENRFELTANQTSQVTGLVGWFESQLTREIMISTSPTEKPTHWKQIFFPLDEPCSLREGEKMLIDFIVEPGDEDFDQCDFSYRCVPLS